jgi:hypothetical protein
MTPRELEEFNRARRVRLEYCERRVISTQWDMLRDLKKVEGPEAALMWLEHLLTPEGEAHIVNLTHVTYRHQVRH